MCINNKQWGTLFRWSVRPTLPGGGVPRVPQHDTQGVQGLPTGDQQKGEKKFILRNSLQYIHRDTFFLFEDDSKEEGAERDGRQVPPPVANAAAEDARQNGKHSNGNVRKLTKRGRS